MYHIISQNISLFRDKHHLSYCELSEWIAERYQVYISPFQIKKYEEGVEISAKDLFYIALALKTPIEELYEESPIL